MDKAWFIQSRQGNIKDQYYFEKKLGSGGYGAVYLAKNKLTGRPIFNCISEWFRSQSSGKGHVEGQNNGLRVFSKRNSDSHAISRPNTVFFHFACRTIQIL